MKIRYKEKFSEKWKNGNLKDIGKLLSDHYAEVEVRLPCEHVVTFVVEGVRLCSKCGDLIEITSFRD